MGESQLGSIPALHGSRMVAYEPWGRGVSGGQSEIKVNV